MTPLRRLRALLARLGAALGSRHADEARMAEEMRFHLEHLADRYVAEGVPPDEARRRAALAFGGVANHQDDARRALRVFALDEIARDLRVCLRRFRRAPVATLSIVATLALCIGATTGVFSIVNAVLLRDIPFATPDRLVWIASVRPDRNDAPLSLPEFMEFGERARHVTLGAFANWSASLATEGGAQRLQGMRMSARGFDVLGAPATAGRLLHAADDAAGADRAVVLSHAFWLRQFGGDTAAALGTTLRLNGEPFTIVGVLPRYFPLPLRDVDVVVPLAPDRDPRRHLHGSTNFLRVFGRLAESASPADAEQELAGFTRDLRDRHGTAYASKLGVRLTQLQEQLVGGSRRALFMMLGSVALMLLIALTNVGNLLLIRATARQGDVALQRALGASTRTIARQLVTEGAVLAGAGGLAGAALAWWSVALTARLGPLRVLRLEEARIDWTALLVALALSLAATALFSVLPLGVALRADPQAALAASGRMRSGSRGHGRLRTAGVIAEVALALVLVSGTTTMVQSLARLQQVDLGYRPDSVFIARLALPPQAYNRLGNITAFYGRLQDAFAARSEVVAAGLTSVAPLSGLLASVPVAVVDAPLPPGERPSANYRVVSPGYLAAIRATMLRGRGFTEADDSSAIPVAIVSRAFADRFLPGDPIGRQILVDDNNTGPRPLTVVGVMADMRLVALEGQPTDDVYIPLRQAHPDGVGLLANVQFWTIRVATDPSRFHATFRRILQEVDRDAASSGLGTLQGSVDAVLAPRRFSVALLVAFAGMALVLATVGVYGVMAYSVELRRREIALRLALGASPGGAVGLVLRNALGVVAVGIASGSVLALAFGRAMEGLWFGVAPGDPLVLGGVAALLGLTTMLASWMPARRAARIAPIVALAGE